MNRKLYFSAAMALGMHALSGQITIEQSHLVTVGSTVINATNIDPMPIPAGGANKTWNFSGLVSDSKDTLKFGASSWYPGSNNFPGATLGLEDEDSTYTFLKLNSTEFSIMGGYAINDGVPSVTDFGFRLLKLPMTSTTSFSDTSVFDQDPFELGFDVDGGGPLPTIDSVAISVILLSVSSSDGWGSLITPLGTNDALRVSHMRTTSLKAKILVSGFWVDAPKVFLDSFLGAGPADTTYQHFYWTNKSSIGFPLMSYNYSAGEDSASDITWLSAAPTVNGTEGLQVANVLVVYPNPANNVVFVKSPYKSATATLLDMRGRELQQQRVSNTFSMKLNEVANGTYLVRVVSDTGEVLTQRMVKK